MLKIKETNANIIANCIHALFKISACYAIIFIVNYNYYINESELYIITITFKICKFYSNSHFICFSIYYKQKTLQ